MTPPHDDIPGLDRCVRAARRARASRAEEEEHRRQCPVCRRRWRVTVAARSGWAPVEENVARALLRPMAARFTAEARPDDAVDDDDRGFWAALARHPGLEADFACEVMAALAPETAPVPPPFWRGAFD